MRCKYVTDVSQIYGRCATDIRHMCHRRDTDASNKMSHVCDNLKLLSEFPRDLYSKKRLQKQTSKLRFYMGFSSPSTPAALHKSNLPDSVFFCQVGLFMVSIILEMATRGGVKETQAADATFRKVFILIYVFLYQLRNISWI